MCLRILYNECLYIVSFYQIQTKRQCVILENISSIFGIDYLFKYR